MRSGPAVGMFRPVVSMLQLRYRAMALGLAFGWLQHGLPGVILLVDRVWILCQTWTRRRGGIFPGGMESGGKNCLRSKTKCHFGE